jgi:hypothetical protein
MKDYDDGKPIPFQTVYARGATATAIYASATQGRRRGRREADFVISLEALKIRKLPAASRALQ